MRRKTFHRTVNELLAAWEDGGVRHFIPVTFQLYEPHVDALLMAFTTPGAENHRGGPGGPWRWAISWKAPGRWTMPGNSPPPSCSTWLRNG